VAGQFKYEGEWKEDMVRGSGGWCPFLFTVTSVPEEASRHSTTETCTKATLRCFSAALLSTATAAAAVAVTAAASASSSVVSN
jgi:hypothetical protein